MTHSSLAEQSDSPRRVDPRAEGVRRGVRLRVRKGRGPQRSWQARLTAVAFALPVLIVFGYFSWGPIISGVVMSFQKVNLVDAAQWVGLSNFEYVLADPMLPKAVLTTLTFALFVVVFGMPVPIVLAVFINELRRSKGLYNALSYLPVVVPPVAAILLWKFAYSPNVDGIFNTILAGVGLGPFPWLNSEASAIPSIVLQMLWSESGATAIIYLAALTVVASELYEAAEIDGAGIWRRIWHVTLPQMRTVILVILLLQLIGVFQLFTGPYLFTGGGPNNSTRTILMLIFNYAFVQGDYGAATALSVMLAVFLIFVATAYQLLTRRWSKR